MSGSTETALPPYTLVVEPPARRHLANRISEAAATAIVEFMYGPLQDNPYRVTKPLRDQLAGYRGARRGEYRVVCKINDQSRTVHVWAIDHRRDSYRRR